MLEGAFRTTDTATRAKPVLLIIDDLEQILETPKPGEANTPVKANYSVALASIIAAFRDAETESRLLLTSRYTFALTDARGDDLAARLVPVQLPPMDETQRDKQMRAAARLARARRRCRRSEPGRTGSQDQRGGERQSGPSGDPFPADAKRRSRSDNQGGRGGRELSRVGRSAGGFARSGRFLHPRVSDGVQRHADTAGDAAAQGRDIVFRPGPATGPCGRRRSGFRHRTGSRDRSVTGPRPHRCLSRRARERGARHQFPGASAGAGSERSRKRRDRGKSHCPTLHRLERRRWRSASRLAGVGGCARRSAWGIASRHSQRIVTRCGGFSIPHLA
jgi:hypothetical protein